MTFNFTTKYIWFHLHFIIHVSRIHREWLRLYSILRHKQRFGWLEFNGILNMQIADISRCKYRLYHARNNGKNISLCNSSFFWENIKVVDNARLMVLGRGG